MMTGLPGCSEGTQKSTIWKTYQDKDPTKDLLQIVGSERIQSMLLDRSVLKKLVWAQVAEDMKALGYDMGIDGGKACHQKWRNLKRAYIMYITKPGHRDPPYIKELQKALETTRKLILPMMKSPNEETGDSNDPYDTEQGSPNKSSNLSVHVADVLAIMVKNNKDRQEREEALNAVFEERFEKLETIIKQQKEQLERMNDLMLEFSKSHGKKRKYSESIQE